MILGIPKEAAQQERRVALVPETVQRLSKQGIECIVESGAGKGHSLDEEYEEAGARVVSEAAEVYREADIVVKVARPSEAEIPHMREGQVLLCFVNGPTEPELVENLAEAGITVFSNEAVPRTSVAQSMDALSSMGSIAGYKTAIIAADTLERYVPMLSTAAGTTKAAKVMVFGVAVAGLQAIAIMNRLGAEVFAYDIRPETKDQTRSLGATFIDSNDEREEDVRGDDYEEYQPTGFRGLMTKLGFYSFAEPPREEYVVEGEENEEKAEPKWDREKLAADQRLIRERLSEMDIVITTALIPGRKAPTLVDREMVESMKPGSIVVDLAAESGGNCELTKPGETVEHGRVRVLGPVNLPSRMPIHASQLLSRNMFNLISHIIEDAEGEGPWLKLDFEDEIISGTCLAHAGEIRHGPTHKALKECRKESEAG